MNSCRPRSMLITGGGDSRYGGDCGMSLSSARRGGHGDGRTMPLYNVSREVWLRAGAAASRTAVAFKNARRVTPRVDTGRYTTACLAAAESLGAD